MSIVEMLLPHRFFINRSLEKEAESFRKNIDDYREEYEYKTKKCSEEIELLAYVLDDRYQKKKSSVESEICAYSELYGSLERKLSEYIDLIHKREYLYEKKRIKECECDIKKEYMSFLTSQMSAIGDEIEIYEKRIQILSNKAGIDDIRELIANSGYAIDVRNTESADDLLEVVNEKINSLSKDDTAVLSALIRLGELLKERSSYAAESQYISWVKEQKRQFSKSLKKMRSNEQAKLKELDSERADIKSEIKKSSQIIDDKLESIINYWNEEIERIDEKHGKNVSLIREVRRKIKSISSEIETMNRDSSFDTSRWNRLWNEKKELIEERQKISNELDNISSRKKDMQDDINEIRQIMRNYSIPFELKKSNNGYVAIKHQKKENINIKKKRTDTDNKERQGIQEQKNRKSADDRVNDKIYHEDSKTNGIKANPVNNSQKNDEDILDLVLDTASSVLRLIFKS